MDRRTEHPTPSRASCRPYCLDRRAALAAMLCAVLPHLGALAAGEAKGERRATDLDLELFRAVIEDVAPKGTGELTVVDRTYQGPYLIRLPEIRGVTPDLGDSLVSRNQEPALIPRFSASIPLRFLSPAESERVRRELRGSAKTGRGAVRLALPGWSRDGQSAAVYFEWYRGAGDAEGLLYFLRRSGKGWTIERRGRIWIS